MRDQESANDNGRRDGQGELVRSAQDVSTTRDRPRAAPDVARLARPAPAERVSGAPLAPKARRGSSNVSLEAENGRPENQSEDRSPVTYLEGAAGPRTQPGLRATGHNATSTPSRRTAAATDEDPPASEAGTCALSVITGLLVGVLDKADIISHDEFGLRLLTIADYVDVPEEADLLRAIAAGLVISV